MPRRGPNYRLVKIHRNYTVEEAARMFGIHKNTVRAWIEAGLPVCKGHATAPDSWPGAGGIPSVPAAQEEAAMCPRGDVLLALSRSSDSGWGNG